MSLTLTLSSKLFEGIISAFNSIPHSCSNPVTCAFILSILFNNELSFLGLQTTTFSILGIVIKVATIEYVAIFPHPTTNKFLESFLAKYFAPIPAAAPVLYDVIGAAFSNAIGCPVFASQIKEVALTLFSPALGLFSLYEINFNP